MLMRFHFDPRRALRIGFCVLSLSLLPACRSDVSRTASATSLLANAVRSEIYFGTQKPDGSAVTAAEWATFRETQLAPAFPEGFSVVDVAGHYRTHAGQVQNEATRLVILLHADATAPSEAIQRLIEHYKKQFQQESVLWVRTPARREFR